MLFFLSLQKYAEMFIPFLNPFSSKANEGPLRSSSTDFIQFRLKI